MARQLELPLVYAGSPARLLVEPCEHGGWDVTLVEDGRTPALHVHCRNWQRVERFRMRLVAEYGAKNEVKPPRALATVATVVIACLFGLGSVAAQRPLPEFCRSASVQDLSFHFESKEAGELRIRFSDEQIALLEKLNRADRDHLALLPDLVVPDRWFPDEALSSALPSSYDSAKALPKLLLVYLPAQLFGAYEFGALVRWGPLSSGARNSQTPDGLYALNWKSTGHASSVDPDWYMSWYFNFGNREGLAFHEYALPGRPASHGCIRLLQRDAQWLFNWGDEWVVDTRGRIVQLGTPVFIVGTYDFDAAPPWRSLEWLAHPVDLPPLPVDEDRHRSSREAKPRCHHAT